MKKIIFIATIMTCFCCAFAAETSFRMSDGTRVSGKVISVTDNAYTVETESGIIAINKSEIQRMRGRNTPDFRAKSLLEGNIDYITFKRNFKIGLGFFIPGTVLLATPLIFFNGLAIYGIGCLTESTIDKDTKVGIASGLSCYFLSIGIGLIFELISIPFFATAAKHYKRAVEQYRVSFDAGFSSDSLKMAMNVSF